VVFLALSVSDAAEDVIAAIRAGAPGYVTKPISGRELADAVRRVRSDDAMFSPRLASFVLDMFSVGPAAGLNESQRPVSRLGSAEQACIEQAATAVVLTAAVVGRLRLLAERLGVGGQEAGVENSFVAADAEETALVPAPCVAAARVAAARVATGAAAEGGVVPAAGASGSAEGRVVAARIRGSGRGIGPACLRVGGAGAGRDACEGARRYDGCGVIE
jgi:CheY-like chemotaxis protein